MLAALPRHGLRAVLMHFRGCSGEPNRLPRAYHSGDTGDIDFVVRTLKAREPGTPLAAIGYSLGGNALLKWLGEQGTQAPVRCAVAVSVPFLLHESSAHLNRGFARVYQRHLMQSLKHNVRRKAAKLLPPVPLDTLDRMQSFFDFDDRITGPLHGFKDAMHYYTASSSRQYLNRIRIPTLIVHAVDDPFMPASVIPKSDELSPAVSFHLHRHGGHVGFISGGNPWRPRYWLDQAIPVWLGKFLAEQESPRL
jgi:predicted alpha/beta-fold hydrolase